MTDYINKINNITNLFYNLICRGSDYKLQHRAPRIDAAPLHELTKNGVYPSDVYSINGPRYYGFGDRTDFNAWSIVFKSKDKPNAMIKIYRAVPRMSPPIQNINSGDWVTIDKSYAISHGQGFEDYDILNKIVPASSLYTDGNSILEWGYYE
jgi:hypothetical protein